MHQQHSSKYGIIILAFHTKSDRQIAQKATGRLHKKRGQIVQKAMGRLHKVQHTEQNGVLWLAATPGFEHITGCRDGPIMTISIVLTNVPHTFNILSA